MARDPADIGHAPVDVFRMNILDVFGRTCDIGQVSASAVLTALRSARGAACVHQKQRVLGQHLHRIYSPAPVTRQHLVHDEVAALDQWRWARIPAGGPLPHQHLRDPHALLCRFVKGDVSFLFVIQQLAAAAISVHRDQHTALGIDDAIRHGLAAEPTEDLRVNDAEPRAGEHSDWKLWHHWHVERHSLALLQTAELSQQRGHLVYANVEFLVGHMLDRFVLRLGDEVDRRLVLVLGEMAIDAVVTSVEPTDAEPSPDRLNTRIERSYPRLVPVTKISILLEAVRKLLEAESFEDRVVGQVGLSDEFLRRVDVSLFLPMDRNLGLGYLCHLILCHTPPPTSSWRKPSGATRASEG